MTALNPFVDRMINELLYKSDSVSAHEMMRKDPNVFSEVCFTPSSAPRFVLKVSALSITPVSGIRSSHGPRTQ